MPNLFHTDICCFNLYFLRSVLCPFSSDPCFLPFHYFSFCSLFSLSCISLLSFSLSSSFLFLSLSLSLSHTHTCLIVFFITVYFPFRFGFARDPLINRLPSLSKRVPVAFLYGEHSWMDSSVGQHLCDTMGDHVTLDLIPEAGHHIYIDNAEYFNHVVLARLSNQAM